MSVTICAELGTTANGDLPTMLRLIDAAKAAGADVVKPMIIGADAFMSDRSVIYTYQAADGERSENMYEMFKKLEFTADEWRQIVAHCDEVGIDYFFTVDYVDGVALAEELETSAYKVSAWDIRNFPLIAAIAETGKITYFDLGPALFGEVVQLVQFWRKHGGGLMRLIHCTHGPEDTANLASIPFLNSQSFVNKVGWSADGRDDRLDHLAIAAGAQYIEKRITLDRTYPGHHHAKALEPDEFAAWVKRIRETEAIMGEFAVRPSLDDLRQKDLYFTSIVAARDIAEGELVTEDMLAAKRPGRGISPLYIDRFVGKRTIRAFKEDEGWTWDAVP